MRGLLVPGKWHRYQRFSSKRQALPKESSVNRHSSNVHSTNRQPAKDTPENSQALNVTPTKVAQLKRDQYQLHRSKVQSRNTPSGPPPSKCSPEISQNRRTPDSHSRGSVFLLSYRSPCRSIELSSRRRAGTHIIIDTNPPASVAAGVQGVWASTARLCHQYRSEAATKRSALGMNAKTPRTETPRV